MITAVGGITAATADIAIAAGIDQKRTTFHASRISTMQVVIKMKYQRRLLGVLMSSTLSRDCPDGTADGTTTSGLAWGP